MGSWGVLCIRGLTTQKDKYFVNLPIGLSNHWDKTKQNITDFQELKEGQNVKFFLVFPTFHISKMKGCYGQFAVVAE